jgi:hypothetical protein
MYLLIYLLIHSFIDLFIYSFSCLYICLPRNREISSWGERFSSPPKCLVGLRGAGARTSSCAACAARQGRCSSCRFCQPLSLQPFQPKQSPQQTFVEYPRSLPFPWRHRPSFTPIQYQRQTLTGTLHTGLNLGSRKFTIISHQIL